MTSEQDREDRQRFADEMARGSAHLYTNIVDWYVETFFEDLDDADWLNLFADALPPNGLVVDVGAGPGNFARVLNDRSLSVVSSDIAFGMVDASRELVPTSPPLVADMRHLPLATSAIDGVLCAYSIMHVPAPATEQVLSEFARVLRPTGVLQLMIKTGDGAYQFRSSLVDDGIGFVQLWEPETMASMLATAGISVFDVRQKEPTSPHEFEHPKVMMLARNRGWA